MFKLLSSILTVIFTFIALIFAFFIDIIKIIFNLILGKPFKKTPVKKTNKNKRKIYEYDKENNIWHLSEEDKNIAKNERMSYADYIEAEERDDDNLDTDD